MTRGTPVGPGTMVELKFSLRLADGQVVDSTGDKSARFVVGDGNLLPGFERVMYGLTAGEQREFLINPEQGFGVRNPENVQHMPRSSFGSDMTLSKGLVVSFSDQGNGELPGVITRLLDDTVEVDFNHPLAGMSIRFDVEIISVDQVSNEIIRTS
ncbi:MAG: peptidylprolyl isomerase [Proteobacteria bacterium]|jgi:FKBP-type peptidyl-prolyl cis-trans isomerase SlpA|nr:peptidylprolyl isomerase [Pseudomonadota bacterium]MDA1302221.1 peptidylprolyl isomerase [Pseudomonadota bacterium]